jgi:hypothetical protein
MSRTKKKRSSSLDRALVRYGSISSINPALDFGDGLTIDAFDALIAETTQALVAYNKLLSDLDHASNTLKELEKSLSGMTSRMLSGVATRYGKESIEYEMAGGTRPNGRRKSKPAVVALPEEGVPS